ncbi:MAG: acetyltransferase [Candidatus Vogelbacteria bacterium]|nr:acetyltransferase [Candidatus Vogelbacteria bacterium]
MNKQIDTIHFDTLILGSGGAGRTAASIIEIAKGGSLAFLEDSPKSKTINGISIAGKIAERIKFRDSKFIIAFGTNYLKERVTLYRQMLSEGFDFENAIYPQAYIDRTATLGIGNVASPGFKLMPNARVGNCCFFCVNSSVDHDCEIQDGVYLAPGATLCGGTIIEEGAFIGANATILPQVRVGSYSVVGAGAVVTRDVPPKSVVVGVPAYSR